MKKNYIIIPEDKCYIAIEKNSIDKITNLCNLSLSTSSFSNAIWPYKNIDCNQKGFLINIDSFFCKKIISFSNKGTLFMKKYGEKTFSIFTNNKVDTFVTSIELANNLEEKNTKILPKKLLHGIFDNIYYKKKKYVFCLNINSCYKAYKHLIE